MPDQPTDLKSPLVGEQQGEHRVHVWAAGIKTPLRYSDPDARLDEGERHTDQLYGQSNWHVCFDFSTLANLADMLEGGKFELPSFVCNNLVFGCGPIGESQVVRLAISAHGAPGAMDIDGIGGPVLDTSGPPSQDPQMLNVTTLNTRYLADFKRIEHVLRPRAKVFFMCCLTGEALEGRELLKAISLVWKDKEIMVYGYRSVLYTDPKQKRTGSTGSAHYPGCRETHYSTIRSNDPNQMPRYYMRNKHWNDLTVLPWAAENTPHAVMAYKGVIIDPGAPPANHWDPDPVTKPDGTIITPASPPWIDPPDTLGPP